MSAELPRCVCAGVENRAREVGIAKLDLSGGVITLYQYIERQRYHSSRGIIAGAFAAMVEEDDEVDEENDVKRKGVLILCDSRIQKGHLNLNSALREEAMQYNVEEVLTSRGTFDDSAGSVLLSQIAAKGAEGRTDAPNGGGETRRVFSDAFVEKKYLCFAAAAALIKYLESENNLLSGAMVKVKFEDPAHVCVIDNKTILGLNLVRGRKSSGLAVPTSPSLFDVLGANVRTTGAKKLLRQNIVQPPRDISTIEGRLCAVEELLDSETLLVDSATLIANFPRDFEKIVSGSFAIPVHSSSSRSTALRLAALIKNLLRLKDALSLVEKTAPFFESVESELLTAIGEVCGNGILSDLKDAIADVLNPMVGAEDKTLNSRAEICFALRAGVDGMLDKSRKCFSEITEAVNTRASEYREMHNLPSLKLNFTESKQFFITFKERECQAESLPEEFRLVNVKGANVHATTQEIISLNLRLSTVTEDCMHLTEKHLWKLHEKIQDAIDALSNLSESISFLDMLTGFASLVQQAREAGGGLYTRPRFDERSPFALRDARHPLLDPMGTNGFVANNLYLSPLRSMVIVQGSNMSGKTTYAVTCALIAVLAHIGCFVPASYASVFPMDRVLTRLVHGDDLSSRAGSFMAEMLDVSSIISDATENSLVIIDELGRSTSTIEGFGISWAVLEELICLSAPTVVCTHMSMLSMLARVYPFVRNVSFQVEYDTANDRIEYLHKLAETNIDSSFHYGIALARNYLPHHIISHAIGIANMLSDDEQAFEAGFRNSVSAQSDGSGDHERLMIDVAQKVGDLFIAYNSMESADITACLRELYMAVTGKR